MTYKFQLNKYHQSYCFLWDDKDETVEELNSYLKEVKGDHFSAIRCYNEETGHNDSNVLCILKEEGQFRTSTYYYVGNFILDIGEDYFRRYDELAYLEADNIKLIEINESSND